MNEAHSPAPHAAVVYHPLKVPVRRLRAVVAEHEAANGWARTRWHETAGDDSGRAAAESALAHRPAVVLVAGGDGTVRAVAEVMQATGIPIALIPLGTGNLLARDIGAPLNDSPPASARRSRAGIGRWMPRWRSSRTRAALVARRRSW